MLNIENLLSKHFAGETLPEEEKLIAKFKLENPEEYQAFKVFWTEDRISMKNVDQSKAWENITKKAQKIHGNDAPKIQPSISRPSIYRKLAVAVSIAAMFLLISTVGLRFYQQYNASNQLAVADGGEMKKIALEDGSTVYLNKNAKLHYPSQFESDERQVTLEGEAFFEIAKDAHRPFRINTVHSVVEVLGTSFNIDTETNQTEISVATGKVKIKSLKNDESAILTPNQSALLNKNQLEVFATKDQNYLAWKTGIFNFEKASLNQVVKELNGFYNNKIILSNQEADCQLSSSFNQLELKDVLEIIQLSCKLKLETKNGNYELH